MTNFFSNFKNKLSILLGNKGSAKHHFGLEDDWYCDEEFLAEHDEMIRFVPERLTSGTAQTLESLLMGKRIHCMSASKGAASNRLKDHIASLRKKYHWEIESEYTNVLTKDGRLQRVMEYWLAPSVIAKAKSEGLMEWCKEVRAACRERKHILQSAKVNRCNKISMSSDCNNVDFPASHGRVDLIA